MLALCPGILNTLGKQVIGIAVSLELAGYPEAVNMHAAIRQDGIPGFFRGYIFDENLSPCIQAAEYKAVLKTVLHPGLFGIGSRTVLFIGNGAANVLAVNVVFGDCDKFHNLIPFSGGPVQNNVSAKIRCTGLLSLKSL